MPNIAKCLVKYQAEPYNFSSLGEVWPEIDPKPQANDVNTHLTEQSLMVFNMQ